jgi:hypothetical protein
VSLKSPVEVLIIGQKAIIIGLAETAVKKEKGAKLFEPSTFLVEITAIGRGMIEPIRNL